MVSPFSERLAVFESACSSLVEMTDVDSSIIPYSFIEVWFECFYFSKLISGFRME